MQELTGIRALSASGGAQLAADLDYFCNVLGALGVALPLQLATWQVWKCGHALLVQVCLEP